MENLEEYYVTGGFDITNKRQPDNHKDSQGKLPLYTAGDGLNGPRPNKSNALAHLKVSRDAKIMNREPFKPKMDLESLLKRKGAVGIDKLEELREEQEIEADEEQKLVESR